MGEQDDDGLPADVREELRKLQIGHNLHTVMNDPTGGHQGDQGSLGWLGSLNPLSSMFEYRDEGESAPPIQAVVAPVSLSDFDEYLRRNRHAIRRFVRNHHVKTHAEVQTKKLALRRKTSFDSLNNRSSVRPGPGSKASESVLKQESLAQRLAQAVGHDVRRRGSSGEEVELSLPKREQEEKRVQARRKKLSSDALRVCLEKVPGKFFQADYKVNLEDSSPLISEGSAEYLVQEQLSNWLDLVEVTLWSQTTSQAQEFFSALTDLHELNAYVKDTCDTISKLRSHVAKIRQSLVNNHLAVLQQRRRKDNMTKLESLLAKVCEVRDTIPMVDQLLATGSEDYAGALGLLGVARNVLSTELGNINSLRTLNRQVDDYEDMIVGQLSDKFVNMCVTWGDEEEEEEEEDRNGYDHDSEKERAALQERKRTEALAEKLMPLVVGLLSARSDPMRSVLTHYRTRIIGEVKSAAKSSVAESLAALKSEPEETAEEPTVSSSSSKTSQLATLTNANFLSFLSLVFDSLEMVMERAHRVHTAFLVCLDRVKNDASNLGAESMEILSRVCELSQNSMQKLLVRRLKEIEKIQASKENAFLEKRAAFENIRAKLDDEARETQMQKIRAMQEKLLESQPQLADFKRMYDKVGSFSLRAEKLSSPSTSIELKGALRLAAKNFLGATHEGAMSRLRTTIDSDQWRGEPCPRQTQASVNRLVSSGRLSSSSSLANSSSSSSSSKGARELLILGKSYRIVSTIIPLIEESEKYLACAQQLSLSSACLPLLVEMLRLFNERTNALVLRAEAIRTANLKGKKIIPKNLALASQALSIVLALVPSMQDILIKCLPKASRHFEKDKTQVQVQLDQLETEFKKHRERIFKKFVEMIEEALNVCCGVNMPKVDWDDRAPSDIKPQKYMEDLTQNIKSLHNSLERYLPREHLLEVFKNIFAMFNTRVPQLYENVQPKTGVGASQVRVDLRALTHCLKLLPGAGDPGDTIDQLANEKFQKASGEQ